MPFVDTDKTMDELLLGTHTDYIDVWVSVHDEVDLVVPEYLRNPIMKRVVSEISLKDVLDKFKLSGLGLSFDVEFDKWQAWTASDSVAIYKYPKTQQEDSFMQKLANSLKSLKPIKKSTSETQAPKPEPTPSVKSEPKPKETVSKPKKVRIPIAKVTKELLTKISKLPDGRDIIVVQYDDKTEFVYQRRVTYQDDLI